MDSTIERQAFCKHTQYIVVIVVCFMPLHYILIFVENPAKWLNKGTLQGFFALFRGFCTVLKFSKKAQYNVFLLLTTHNICATISLLEIRKIQKRRENYV